MTTATRARVVPAADLDAHPGPASPTADTPTSAAQPEAWLAVLSLHGDLTEHDEPFETQP